MGYPYQPYGAPYQPYGQPYGPYQNSMMAFIACEQPTGLGGKQQVIPLQYPINLQYVAQQVVMFLMGQGFQAYPMIAQNMAVIQAQHSSLLGTLTDQNKAYTIRLCQGPGILVVETGIANLMQDLLVAGGTQLLTDEVLHSKLLGLVVGGIDVYGIYKDYAQEEQIMNMITMLVMSAPPAGPVPGQYPNPQGYPQYQPYPQNPYQQAAPVPQPQVQQPSQQRQTQTQQEQLKCWSCGSPVVQGAKFCPQCGVSLQEVKCPQCGTLNPPSAKFCSGCGAKLGSTQVGGKS
jgi:hypothetical protein